jgi:hypothetical protein
MALFVRRLPALLRARGDTGSAKARRGRDLLRLHDDRELVADIFQRVIARELPGRDGRCLQQHEGVVLLQELVLLAQLFTRVAFDEHFQRAVHG